MRFETNMETGTPVPVLEVGDRFYFKAADVHGIIEDKKRTSSPWTSTYLVRMDDGEVLRFNKSFLLREESVIYVGNKND